MPKLPVIIFLFVVVFIFLFTAVNAGVALEPKIGAKSIEEVVNNIITGIRDYIAPPIVGIMVLVGAFQMLFAAGDPNKFLLGKKAILYAVVGYAIIIIASGVSAIIKEILSG